MDEKYNDSTPNRPDGERILDSPVVQADLATYITQIRQEETWHKYDRNSITIFKTDSICLVLGGLHKNAQLSKQHAEGLMCIQIIEGQVAIHTDVYNTTCKENQVFIIHKGYSYTISATEETIYLLTMTNIG